jgi:hypothetical protein
MPADSLPHTLTHLKFGMCFNQPFDYPPPSLQVLEFAYGFTFQRSIDRLPDTIHKLTIQTDAKINKLPASLTHLESSSNTNNIACPLPSNLQYLDISGGLKTLELSSLPLISLMLSGTKYQPSLDKLPKTLRKLQIIGHWNGPLSSLPPSLTYLMINSLTFKHPLDCLPNSLTHLVIGEECPCPTTLNFIPSSITHLRISSYEFNLPLHLVNNPRVQRINFGDSFNSEVDHLPSTLTHLIFDYEFNQPVNHLPTTLTHLTFGSKFDQPVTNLPSSITHLIFGTNFNQPVDKLPPSIIQLFFGEKFIQNVDNLPPKITELTFGSNFDSPVTKLPHSIITLTFGCYFNQKVDHLPLELTHLSFGYSFNQSVDSLPSSLSSLTLGVKFRQSTNSLPPSLRSLFICCCQGDSMCNYSIIFYLYLHVF